MNRFSHRFILPAAALLGFLAATASAQEPAPNLELLISIADQKMALIRDGGVLRKYPVSTSKFGAGDGYGSYKTPLGQLRVCDKVGADLLPGAVIKHREATGEVLDVNAPGRDPIVTRIIWLDGMEEQNRNAKARGIYIHGTPEEKKIGEAVSWGCIRMRSRDVVELFEDIPVGTPVRILAEKLPRLHKWEPPKPVILVVHAPAPAPAPATPAARTPPLAAARIAAAKPASSKTAVSPAQTPVPKGAASDGVAASAGYVPASFMEPRQDPTIALAGHPRRAGKPVSASEEKAAGHAADSSGEGALLAMKGSILFAGLPDGPAPQTIATTEPRKLLRSAPLNVIPQPDGLSLDAARNSLETSASLFPTGDAPAHLAARGSNPAPTRAEVKSGDR